MKPVMKPEVHRGSPRASMLSSLAPVVGTLLRCARADAANGVAAAQADASAELERARAEVTGILAKARADGDAAAEQASAAAVIAAGREGRETILAAHRRGYEVLRQGVREALASGAGGAQSGALLAHLEALARARLGPDVAVHHLVDGRFGVSATDGKRYLELTADPFVDREITALADRIVEMWR